MRKLQANHRSRRRGVPLSAGLAMSLEQGFPQTCKVLHTVWSDRELMRVSPPSSGDSNGFPAPDQPGTRTANPLPAAMN